jgi:surface protein
MYPFVTKQRLQLLLAVAIHLAVLVPIPSTGQTTDFVTSWKTSNTSTGSSNTKQIKISINAGYTYKYNVNWGDGNTSSNITTGTTHTYSGANTYTVRISGTFPAIYFNNSGDRLKLLTITQWGSTMAWQSFSNSFYGCTNLNVTATDTPLLAAVPYMGSMFENCTSLAGNKAFNNWHTNAVTDMSSMFYGATAFNQNIGSWNTAAVTDMGYMFYGAKAFNQNIGGWNTAAVTNMAGMFYQASAFNQNIGSWNTAAVTNMSGMFSYATSFNQSVAGWNTDAVTDMSYMFLSATAFNQNIGSWATAAVKTMAGMFYGATAFNQNIGSWNTAAVTDMSVMFDSAIAFNQAIGSWSTAAVKNMTFMFAYAAAFNQNIGAWNTAAVTDMSFMFDSALAFNQNIGSWNTAAVTTMTFMFYEAAAFNQDVSGWNTAAVTSMSFMFGSATAFNQNVGIWNTAAVTDMSFMFISATAFNQSLAGFNIGNVTTMAYMLSSTSLSVTNYDNTLIAWQAASHKTNVTLGADGLYYCKSAAARAALIATSGWTITDAGQVTAPTPSISLTCDSTGGTDGKTPYGQFYEGSGQAVSWLWTTTSGGRFYTGAGLSVNSDSTVSHLQAPYVKLQGSYTVTIVGTDGCSSSASYTITPTSCYPVVLSQKMLGFTATAQPGVVLLSWQAAAGDGNGNFLVQRSNNAADWQQIGLVGQTLGGTGFNRYHFLDELPFGGTNYYRVEDANNTAAPEFTPVKQVDIPQNATVKLYPNPAQNLLVLQFNSDAAATAQITATSVAGMQIFASTQPVVKGFNRIQLPQVQILAQGVYFVTLAYANTNFHGTFVKVK